MDYTKLNRTELIEVIHSVLKDKKMAYSANLELRNKLDKIEDADKKHVMAKLMAIIRNPKKSGPIKLTPVLEFGIESELKAIRLDYSDEPENADLNEQEKSDYIKDLEAENSDLLGDLNELRNSTDVQINVLDLKNATLSSAYTRLYKRFREYKDENFLNSCRMQTEIGELETQIGVLQDESGALGLLLESSEDEKDEYKAAYEDARLEGIELKNQIEGLKKYGGLEEHRKLRRQVKRLKLKRKQQNEVIDSLESELQAANTGVRELKHKHQNELTTLKTANRAIAKLLAARDKQIEALKRQIK